MRRRGRKQRGLALLSFAVALMILVPLAGLGIDSALLYITKERLNTAVQLAARTAGKPATVNADDTARRIFDANFPAGYLGIAEREVSCKDGRIQATVHAPAYLMRIFNYSSVEVKAAADYRPAAESPAGEPKDTARN